MKKLLIVEDNPDKLEMIQEMIGLKFKGQFELEWINTYDDFQKAIRSSGEYVAYLLDQDLHRHPDPTLASKTGTELKKEIQGTIPDAVIINISTDIGVRSFGQAWTKLEELLTED